LKGVSFSSLLLLLLEMANISGDSDKLRSSLTARLIKCDYTFLS
jgi:hypothetical protein